MSTVHEYLRALKPPDPYSHKGQNGKLMIIGGSDLFHAASRWSLDVASHFVDMVFYASVPSNNELIREAKQEFWNGIVIGREQIGEYIGEADCVLIGPGMERGEYRLAHLDADELNQELGRPLDAQSWNSNTELVVNRLIHQFPDKKWVIDAGALQMVRPDLIPSGAILTPHRGELDRLIAAMERQEKQENESAYIDSLLQRQISVLLKGQTDYVYSGSSVVEITGGNAGLTKGGTGDVLAGLVAALYCTQTAAVAAVVGSYVNKRTGEHLAETRGTYFNATDLVRVIPEILWQEVQRAQSAA